MTTKSEKKTTQAEEGSIGQPQEQMQTAYQVHTLAQILYGQLTSAQSWAPPVAPMGYASINAMQPTIEYPTTTCYGASFSPWAGTWGTATWGGPGTHHAPSPPFVTGFGFLPR
jgi:hypothetical protein